MSTSIIEVDEIELQSPVSPTGSSSTGSNKKQVSSLDVEDASHTSWRIGMPWFQSPSSPYNNNGSPSRNSNTGIGVSSAVVEGYNASFMSSSVGEENRYYGGIMKPTAATTTGNSGGGTIVPHPTTNMTAIQKQEISTSAFLFRRTMSQDSIGSFKDNEWTPPDSSYGAACPVCGCIPKHVRRMVEFTLIAIMVVGFVYLLITTSINLSDERDTSKSQHRHNNSTASSSSSSSSLTDDDLYLEYTYTGSSSSSSTSSGDDNVASVVDDDYNNKNGGWYYKNNNYRYSYGSYYNNYYYDNNNDVQQGDDETNYQQQQTNNDEDNGGRERIRQLRRS
jgi:hypothetical protein